MAGRLAFALLLLMTVAAPATAQVPFGQGRLWQVEREGAAPSYVFGTFHGTDRRLLELPVAVEDALLEAERLVIEMRLTREVAWQLQAATMAPPWRPLDELVGPETFAQIVAVGDRYRLAPHELKRLRPWTLIFVFGLPPTELARQQAGMLPLDYQLQAIAEERGIPVHGLESVEEQVAIFDGLPDAQQMALLRATIEENEQVESWYDRFLETYLAGNGAGLFELMLAQVSADQAGLYEIVLERLLTTRNLRMVTRLQEHLAAGGTFVAVGDLHLRGEDGILSKLERRGYRISRRL
jgi:uncharacterized protein